MDGRDGVLADGGALADVTRRLGVLVDASPIPILAVDRVGRVTLWSPEAERVFGWSAGEVVGRPLPILDAEERRVNLERVFAGERLSLDAVRRRKDGSSVEVVLSVAALRDGEGRPIGAFALYRDVSERRRAERALAGRERLLRAIVESEPECVMLCDCAGTVTMMNPAGLSMCEAASAEQVVGRRWEELVEAEDATRVGKAIGAAVDGREERLEFELVGLQGGRCLLEASVGPVRGEAGEVTGLVSVWRDVSAQRAAEAEREEQQRSFRAVFEHSLDAMLIADDSGCYIDANPAACELIGLRRDQLVGRRIGTVLRVEPAVTDALWRKAIAAGSARGEMSLSFPDGEVRVVDYRAKARFLPGRHLLVLRDVSERRQLEEQLRQAQKLEAVGRLAGGIAHDFNNLLQAIGGYGQLALTRLNGNEAARAEIEQVLRAGERASELTRQLLAFSRKQVLQPRVLDLNTVVQETETLLGRLIGEDIDVTTLLAPDLGSVRADPAQLSQVLMNLAVNARDAMPDGGTLTITTANTQQANGETEPGRCVTLTLTDTGTGMDAHTKEHAFEPFFTTKKIGEGTGLGLAMVYGAVSQNGGQVTIESEPGQGTTITITLPRIEGEAEQSNAAVAATPAQAAGRASVLLVEDEPLVGDLVSAMLGQHGYTAIHATSPEQALQLAGERHYDLLLTDMVMPKMNGHELAQRLRSQNPGLPVIYTSGYPAQTSLDPGSHFLQKPFSASELIRTLQDALDGSDAPVPPAEHAQPASARPLL